MDQNAFDLGTDWTVEIWCKHNSDTESSSANPYSGNSPASNNAVVFSTNKSFSSTSKLTIGKKNTLYAGQNAGWQGTLGITDTPLQTWRQIVITKTSGTAFTSEMIGGEIRFDLSSQTVFPRQTNVTQPTEFTSSVLSVSSSNILQIKDELTGSLNHVYRFTDSDTIPTKVEFFSSASQGTTANLQTAATFTITNTQPISGEVHQLRTSVKSKGLGTEFETIATNNFNDNVVAFTYTIPIPSKHIGDPKTLKIEFVNVLGEVSDQFVLIEDVVFPGSNTFIGGKGSLISGSIFISNALGSGIELGGASSGFIKSVGFQGQTSASLGKGPGGFIFYSGSGNLTLGKSGEARTVVTDSDISLYSGQATSRKRVAIDNSGKAAFGGAVDADVSVASFKKLLKLFIP